MTRAQLRFTQAAMADRATGVAALCAELGMTRATLYRHVASDGTLRPQGQRLLEG